MFSRALRASLKLAEWKKLLAPRMEIKGRRYSSLIPANQYDVPFPKRLQLGYVLKVYWETIPLFLTTMTSVSLMVASIIYATRNKVDVVFSTHNRDGISRTMDLRNPSIHKFILINQRYEPWPEMAALLEKLQSAEKRLNSRVETCSLAA